MEAGLSTLCAICSHTAADAPSRICNICRGKATDNLKYLGIAAKRFPKMLMPGSMPERIGSGSKSTESSPPLNLEILNLMGPDRPNRSLASSSFQEDQVGELSLLSVLGAWQRVWHREGAPGVAPVTPCRDVAAAVTWLTDRQQWACTSLEPYPDFAKEIGRMARVCLAMMNEEQSHTVKIGECPVELDDDFCGTMLSVRTDAEEISCRSCQSSWPKYVWETLGRAIQEAQQLRRARAAV